MKASPPTAGAYPNTFAWFVLVHRFSDAARAAWTGPQAAAPKGEKKPAAKKEEAPKVEAPKVVEAPKKADDDDDMDLFGDDDEESEVSAIK